MAVRTLLIIFSLFLAATPALSAPKRYSLKVRGDFSGAARLERSKSAGADIKFSFTVPGHGLIHVSFAEVRRNQPGKAHFSEGERIVPDNKRVTLLRGSGRYLKDGRSVPVAGSIYRLNGLPVLFMNFSAPGESDGEQRELFEVRTPVVSGKKIAKGYLSAANDQDFQGALCASRSAQTAVSGQSDSPGVMYSSQLKVIDLATQADYEYFQYYGVNTNAQIASIVNAADVIYRRDLNLTYQITTQNVQSSPSQPYSSTDAGTLLEQFRSHTDSNRQLGKADLYHLFTGKDMDGGTVGVAYVGTACFDPYAYGLTQRLHPTLDYIIFAHEIGHNLDAVHDSSLPQTVMYPSVGSTHSTFSAASTSAINSYVASGWGSCLTAATPTPTPTASPSPTATPDPEPTSIPDPPEPSPTATPNPRINPDPLNPDDGAPAPDTTEIRLRSRFLQSVKLLEAVVSVVGERGERCRLNLEFSASPTFSRIRSVVLATINVRKVKLRAQLSGSVRNSRERIYLRASYRSCRSGGESVYSESSQFTPYDERVQRKVSAQQYISTNLRGLSRAAKATRLAARRDSPIQPVS